ncbi:MAG: hypothetical protein RIE77_14315 [Phycisphaerales bacterium]
MLWSLTTAADPPSTSAETSRSLETRRHPTSPAGTERRGPPCERIREGSGSESDAALCHAAGEPTPDEAEAQAFARVLGERAREVKLSYLSLQLGETMAAGGLLLVSVAAMALQQQRLPAHVHGDTARNGLREGSTPSRNANLNRVLVCTHVICRQCAGLVPERALALLGKELSIRRNQPKRFGYLVNVRPAILSGHGTFLDRREGRTHAQE